MEDLITVIINVYNCEKYIGKCLESIINQTYTNLDILIVNDGSTDNTLKVCEGYKDERIRIINQENRGLSNSRNVGIENAKGEYLYFIDSDDFVEHDAIEYLYSLIKEYQVEIATCGSMQIFDYSFSVKNRKEEIIAISSEEMLKRVLLNRENAGATWNKLVKKDLFEDNKFENRIINDLANTYRLIISTSKVAYSNQIKYYYLKHIDGITVKKRKDINRCIDIYNVSLERYGYIKNRYPYLVENEVYMLKAIVMLYLFDKKEVQDFLNSQGTIELYKKMFSIRILNRRVSFREKLKLILFRVSPKLCLYTVRIFLKIKYLIIHKGNWNLYRR